MRTKVSFLLGLGAFAIPLWGGAGVDAKGVLETVNDRLAREFISHDGSLLDYVGGIPTPEEIARTPAWMISPALRPVDTNAALVKASDLTGHMPDGIHFDTPSYTTLGIRYYEAWKRLSNCNTGMSK